MTVQPYQASCSTTSIIYGNPGQVLSITPTGPSWVTAPNIISKEEMDILNKRILNIEERLAILQPNKDLQERFPALQEAYDSYKMIEKMVQDPKKE